MIKPFRVLLDHPESPQVGSKTGSKTAGLHSYSPRGDGNCPQPSLSSGPYGILAAFYAGHTEGSRIVRLTARSFLVEALCGEPIDLDGEPEIAVFCEDCDRLGREAGGDPREWVTETGVRVELRAAA